ncbi:MAG TPA: PEP-CTERM sorting domain-containing protein [Myxococcota bacterium]
MQLPPLRFAPCLRVLLVGGILIGFGALPARAVPIDPASSTVGWTPIAYPTLLPDFSDDQRTGIPEADIVGDTTNAAFYFRFDDAGTPSTTDGAIGFRVRIGADKNPSGFDHFMGVGIDANADGALDLFLAVENSGNPDQLGIFDAGSDANTSPSTTSINSTPLVGYALSVSNYDFEAVTAALDPGATDFDIDGDGDTDQFLTWVIPFGAVVTALAGQGIAGFGDNVAMRFVIGSSTQPNALNQDLGGPDGGTTSTSSWSSLGAISNFATAAGGFTPIPEPNTGALFALGLFGLAVRARTRD